MSAQRDVGMDAIKGVLIVLVVLGHLIEPSIDAAPAFRSVWAAIYTFHMPLFVLVSGIFAKDVLTRRDCDGLIQRVLLPLAVFQAAYLAAVYVGKHEVPHSILQPHWILWFLLSLACWRVALPMLAPVRGIVVLTVLVSVLAGYVEDIGYTFSLSRTLYFLPFFLAGHLYGNRAIHWAREHVAASLALLLVPLALVEFAAAHGLSHSLLYGSMGYALTGPHIIAPGLERALIVVLSFSACIGFAGLAARPIAAAAYLGERSLTVFVLHGFVVMAVSRATKVLHIAPTPPLLAGLAVVAISTAFALAPLDARLNAGFARLASLVQRKRDPVPATA